MLNLLLRSPEAVLLLFMTSVSAEPAPTRPNVPLTAGCGRQRFGGCAGLRVAPGPGALRAHGSCSRGAESEALQKGVKR